MVAHRRFLVLRPVGRLDTVTSAEFHEGESYGYRFSRGGKSIVYSTAYDDSSIERVLRETARYEEISRDGHSVEVISAYDGLELII